MAEFSDDAAVEEEAAAGFSRAERARRFGALPPAPEDAAVAAGAVMLGAERIAFMAAAVMASSMVPLLLLEAESAPSPVPLRNWRAMRRWNCL